MTAWFRSRALWGTPAHCRLSLGERFSMLKSTFPGAKGDNEPPRTSLPLTLNCDVLLNLAWIIFTPPSTVDFADFDSCAGLWSVPPS